MAPLLSILAFAINAGLAAASYTLSVQGSCLDGKALNACANGFYLGLDGPCTQSPSQYKTNNEGKCSATALDIPYLEGGKWIQTVYVGYDGGMQYDTAHSSPPLAAYTYGIGFEDSPNGKSLSWKEPHTDVGGFLACSNIPDYMKDRGATHQIFAKTSKSTRIAGEDGCIAFDGLNKNPGAAGCNFWSY